MADKRLAAAFFVPVGDSVGDGGNDRVSGGRRPAPDQVIRDCGAVVLRPSAGDVPGLVTVEWAGLLAWCAVEQLPYHTLLMVFFRQTDFLDLVDVDPKDHPVARSLCGAAPAVGAEVAFVATHLDLAEPERIRATEWMMLAPDPNVLVGEHFGLVYLAPPLVPQLTVPLDDRDQVACHEGGLLVFSHRGGDRWY